MGPVRSNKVSGKAINAVVIGDAASLSFPGQSRVASSWAQLFFREVLPRDAIFVNLATRYAKASEARERETGALSALHPTFALVLLGLDDLYEGTSPAQFRVALDGVLGDIRSVGTSEILLGILPGGVHGIAPYNNVIAGFKGAPRVTLVDLRSLKISVLAGRFIPDENAQRAIANAFIAAYQKLHH